MRFKWNHFIRPLVRIKLIIALNFSLFARCFPHHSALYSNSDFSYRVICDTLVGGGKINRLKYIQI